MHFSTKNTLKNNHNHSQTGLRESTTNFFSNFLSYIITTGENMNY
jgi:hypothetical protein